MAVVTFNNVKAVTEGTNGRGFWKLRVFTATDGTEYTTLDDVKGSQWENLKGRPVEIEWQIKDVKGKAKNELVSVVPFEGGHAEGEKPAAIFHDTAPSTPASFQDQRQTIINRSASLARAIESVAAGIVTVEEPKQLFQIADEYVKYIEQGSEGFGQF